MQIPLYSIQDLFISKGDEDKLTIKQFDIHRGACYVFEGRMGSGKTTFLDALYSRRKTEGSDIRFEEKDIQIFGVSLDNENDNKAFAEKFSFPYPLLCDINREIALGYHAVKSKEDQYAARISYVIGEDGKILESIENVDTKNHSKDLCSRY